MKKILSVAFALTILSITALSAQNNKKFFITVQGGPGFSVNENGQTYFDNGQALDLVKLQGAASLGYYFTPRYGVRLYGEYSQNASGRNVQETMAWDKIWPYTFNSGIGFADFIINGGDISAAKAFNWRPYFGIGAAYTFGFDNLGKVHPWQDAMITKKNFCYAFRYGVILEYIFGNTFGIFVDGSHEWFSDNYNGMAPKSENGEALGFPFDMKLNASLGIAIHF